MRTKAEIQDRIDFLSTEILAKIPGYVREETVRGRIRWEICALKWVLEPTEHKHTSGMYKFT